MVPLLHPVVIFDKPVVFVFFPVTVAVFFVLEPPEGKGRVAQYVAEGGVVLHLAKDCASPEGLLVSGLVEPDQRLGEPAEVRGDVSAGRVEVLLEAALGELR